MTRRAPRLPRLRRRGGLGRASRRRRGGGAALGPRRRGSPRIDTYDGELEEAYPPLSVTAAARGRRRRLARRHDLPARTTSPTEARELDAMVCWMAERPLSAAGRYRIKHTTRTALAKVDDVRYRIDVNTLHRDEDADRASSSTRSAACACACPHRCSSTSTAATAPPAASSSSTSRPTTPSARAWSSRLASGGSRPDRVRPRRRRARRHDRHRRRVADDAAADPRVRRHADHRHRHRPRLRGGDQDRRRLQALEPEDGRPAAVDLDGPRLGAGGDRRRLRARRCSRTGPAATSTTCCSRSWPWRCCSPASPRSCARFLKRMHARERETIEMERRHKVAAVALGVLRGLRARRDLGRQRRADRRRR